jgi:hypothetical protein
VRLMTVIYSEFDTAIRGPCPPFTIPRRLSMLPTFRMSNSGTTPRTKTTWGSEALGAERRAEAAVRLVRSASRRVIRVGLWWDPDDKRRWELSGLQAMLPVLEAVVHFI